MKWHLGRIIPLHTGRDGVTRVVSMLKYVIMYTRPVSKMCCRINLLNVTRYYLLIYVHSLSTNVTFLKAYNFTHLTQSNSYCELSKGAAC